jgi:hypothetical protein
MPDTYKLSLYVDSIKYHQNLTIRMDRRITTARTDMNQIMAASWTTVSEELKKLHAGIKRLMVILNGADYVPTTDVSTKIGEILVKMTQLLAAKK